MNRVTYLLMTCLVVPVAWGDTSPTECDRLASNPEDPDRVAQGVERENVDLVKATAACEAEVAADSGAVRARYQLARVLFYAGQSERAVREMKVTADAGYRQAQFVYGLLISNRRGGAPADICIAESYWLQSARNGRQAARVSYVRHFLNGRFDGCQVQAGPEDMQRFLDEAAATSGNYYEGMLIEDLAARLGAAQQQGRNLDSHRE